MKLEIEKVIYGGQGLARVPAEGGPRAGMKAFVPFTLPGELIEAEIAERHRGYCVAEARRIDQASEFRIAPLCPFFGTCGGCQLQHSAYSYQLEMKREMLAESLQRAGIRELPMIHSLAGAPFAYRNRVRLQVQMQPEFAIGYRQAKSHRLVAIDQCPIAAPLLDRCIAAIRELGMQHKIPSGLRELEIFTNHDQSQMLIRLWMPRFPQLDPPACTEFFATLQTTIPQLCGAVVLPADNSVGDLRKSLLRWGKQELQYRVAGRDYAVGIGSFFQVNFTLLDDFVAAVSQARSGKIAWDLYAGIGLFSLALAEQFERLIAVESNPAACRDLTKNSSASNATAIQSTTLEFLRNFSRKRQGPAPDLVVLDPPRAGAGAEVCTLLAGCRPQQIVYVSCDPATLGRDLALLIQSGYRLERLQLVDMFPQTQHLETIASLHR